MKYEHYCYLANLFDFPNNEFHAKARMAVSSLAERYPLTAAKIKEFSEGIPKDVLDLQELYTRTFDVQAITTLDVGYVMFGDDYKRAELLTNLTREHREADNECRGELPDHLPNVLRLMPKLKDQELLAELVSEIMVPALLLMIREFDSERMSKKAISYRTHYKTLIDQASGTQATIYCLALGALLETIKADFSVSENIEKLESWSENKPRADFLGLVEKEMEIETNSNPVNSGQDS